LRGALVDRLQSFHTARCPFTDLPNTERKSRWGEGITPEDMATFQWVKPKLVVQLRFVEWTEDRHLRHAAFLGVRDDRRRGGAAATT
jgi:bifunctional non-homologous end joining protein LigD